MFSGLSLFISAPQTTMLLTAMLDEFQYRPEHIRLYASLFVFSSSLPRTFCNFTFNISLQRIHFQFTKFPFPLNSIVSCFISYDYCKLWTLLIFPFCLDIFINFKRLITSIGALWYNLCICNFLYKTYLVESLNAPRCIFGYFRKTSARRRSNQIPRLPLT